MMYLIVEILLLLVLATGIGFGVAWLVRLHLERIAQRDLRDTMDRHLSAQAHELHETQDALHQQQTTAETLRHQVAESQGLLQERQQRLHDADGELKRMQQRLDQHLQSGHEHVSRLEKRHDDDMQRARRENEKLQQQVRDMNTRMASERSAVRQEMLAEMEQQKDRFDEVRRQLEADVRQAQSVAAQHRSELQQTMERLASQNQQLAERDKDLLAAEGRIEDARREGQRRVEDAEARLRQLEQAHQARMQTLKEELEASRQVYEQAISDKEQRLAELQGDLQTLRANAQHEHEELKNVQQLHIEQLRALTGDLDHVERARAVLEEKNSEQRRELDRWHADNSGLKDKIAEQERSISALKSRWETLQTNYELLEDQHAEDIRRLTDARRDLEEQERKLNIAGKDTGSQLEEVQRLEAIIAELEDELRAEKRQRHQQNEDALSDIYGIGPAFEELLHELGVHSFKDIAAWTDDDIERIAEHMEVFPDRIDRDGWVQGAREQHFIKYGERL